MSRTTLGRIDDVVDLDAASPPTADECRAHREGPFLDVGRERLHAERGVLDRHRPTRVRRRLAGHSDVTAEGDARRRCAPVDHSRRDEISGEALADPAEVDADPAHQPDRARFRVELHE